MNMRVKAEMERRASKTSDPNIWMHENAIPDETNGWTYIGEWGLAKQASWLDDYKNPDKAVGVIVNPTHPRDKNTDVAEVFYVRDMDNKVESHETITEIEGEPFRTPNHVRERMFWEAVERAITWMENGHGPDSI